MGGVPTVSVVMPCFNAAAHLPLSVGSVLAQTLGDWELIAVDDGSTDGTPAWLKAQADPRIRVRTQTNQGVGSARNAGLAMARGRYVAFLDADDTWEPSFLEKMTDALAARPEAVLAYCGWQNIGLSGGRGQPFVPPDYETPDKREVIFAGCRWPIHAALTKGEAIEAAGGFNPLLKNAEDYALWLEVAVDRPIVRVPEVLAFYHFHQGAQASANRARAALHHFDAQTEYLRQHPEFAASLGRAKVRALLYGQLLQRGLECYWHRDLAAARTLFRAVMRHGYGALANWKYMLPALLPAGLHRWLVNRLSSGPGGNATKRIP